VRFVLNVDNLPFAGVIAKNGRIFASNETRRLNGIGLIQRGQYPQYKQTG
jgi:hypothetical protein